MSLTRGLEAVLVADLAAHDKMLFLAGPRQSGKTTLAKALLKVRPGTYWNHDIPGDRALLVKKPLFYEEIDRGGSGNPLVVLDELHKFPRWKNYLKGAFDSSHEGFRFLVTGSGRLDLYRKGGDSLAGRYFLHRLFPLTIGELADRPRDLADFLAHPYRLPDRAAPKGAWEGLERWSGFPEPFLKGQDAFHRRWSLAYRAQLVREDIRDLTQVRQITQLETLAALLPDRVGSLLSLNALREELGVAFETVKNWIGIMERFLLVFLVRPWSRGVARSLRKEPKLYFYDWTAVDDPAGRFENMVALHLLEASTRWTASGAGEYGLHFVRNRMKQEVDFLVTDGGKPLFLVEAKQSDTEAPASLISFSKKLGVPAILLVNLKGVSRTPMIHDARVTVVSAESWLAALP